jgi:hypothetical protein
MISKSSTPDSLQNVSRLLTGDKMGVDLSIKSIRTRDGTHLVVAYEVKSEIQNFELEVLTPLQTDLNAAEKHARSQLKQFAHGLGEACQNSPLVAQLATIQKRPHP